MVLEKEMHKFNNRGIKNQDIYLDNKNIKIIIGDFLGDNLHLFREV
jgi:hypothetical protein